VRAPPSTSSSSNACAKICERVEICTDDGSYGHKGFVTEVLQEMIDEGERIDYRARRSARRR
jgi:NAD(P)H-flavin reductase